MFLWWPSTKIVQDIVIRQKSWPPRAGLIFPIYLNRKLEKSFCQKTQDRFQYNLAEMFLWMILYQSCSSRHESSKNMTASGRGLFSLYIENFKVFLSETMWTNFSIMWQKCSFGDPLPWLFKSWLFVKKTWSPVWGCGGVLFSLYIYTKNFKGSIFLKNRHLFLSKHG